MVYRVARGFDTFAPPDWGWAKDDGTFGNRFDDPGAYRGIPEELVLPHFGGRFSIKPRQHLLV
jgi:hypothetical protein